ncbi:AAA family ATPase [Gordonia sp. HNM0687]|uniref:AAA family ATPase n=1 Tax=Gordonia mangrovi TaxID=2665643 RepID=A0A6L7GMV2_9ACTN|nr:BTAD domain-containing putative transcriptional regulator [Gordonia mangrovi]MXP21240.1 AAA family ATPase [Gordonia mangrovi]UVF78233.1 AAA family ATPase [Gordonia mangrovi]
MLEFPVVSVLLLGPVNVSGPGDARADQFGSPRLRCLLAALASRANATADADWLAEILWGDRSPTNPESALHNLVFRLRAQLRERGVAEQLKVVTAAPGYSLLVDRSEIDMLAYADRFHEGCAVADTDPDAAIALFDTAEALWRGRPFGEFADEPWVRGEVEALEEMRVRIAEATADALLRSGRPADAASRLEAAAVEYPYRESVHLRRMHGFWQADRPADALEVYRHLRTRLSTDLGTEPAARLADLHERILSGERSPEPVRPRKEQPPARSEVPPPSSSPTQDGDGPLLGRGRELADLAARLRPGTVVTVVGPGGVGKTALVREHVHGRDSTWTAELSGVQSPADVVHSVVSATGSSPRRDLADLDALIESLSPRTGLLVLDNCEHVVDAAAELASAVTSRCPRMAVVATSRVPLGLANEEVSVLEPLTVPAPKASHQEIASTPSVRLFCARARARDNRFALTEDNGDAVAEICRRLDGLPLGVELAATKARAIAPGALVDRLQWRFRILHSSRGHDPRHRSLHALVDWSYTLLSDAGRALFDVLAVFPARFDLDDAEALADLSGVLPGHEVAETISELVDASMLTPDAAGYRMLETLRAFGLRQLDDQDRRMAARSAHARLIADRIAPLGRDLYGPGHVAAAGLIAARLDDVRQAVDHACEADPALGEQLLPGVIPFLELTMSTEATSWSRRLREAAARLPDGEVTQMPAAWAVAAAGARFDGDLPAALDCARSGLACDPDPVVEVYLRMMLVEVGLFQGDLDVSATLAREFRAAATAAGMVGAGRMADLCGQLMNAYRGDGRAAHRASLRVAELCTAAGERVVDGWAKYGAGECILDIDPVTAGTLLDEAIAVAEQTGDRYLMGVALVSRASIEARSGTPEVAARLFTDVLNHWRDAGNWTHQWVSLRTVVDVLLQLDRLEPAAELLGAMYRADEITGAGAYGTDAQRLDAAHRQLRERLGEETVDELMVRGAELPRADVVAAALAALSAG